MATMFLCLSVLRSISVAYLLFFFILIFIFGCSVAATFTVAFSFAVLWQLFTYSVISSSRYFNYRRTRLLELG